MAYEDLIKDIQKLTNSLNSVNREFITTVKISEQEKEELFSEFEEKMRQGLNGRTTEFFGV